MNEDRIPQELYVREYGSAWDVFGRIGNHGWSLGFQFSSEEKALELAYLIARQYGVPVKTENRTYKPKTTVDAELFERVSSALLALHLKEYPTAESREEHEYDEPCETCELLSEVGGLASSPSREKYKEALVDIRELLAHGEWRADLFDEVQAVVEDTLSPIKEASR